MTDEQLWVLGCNSCGKEIKKPVNWFKQPGNACPHCSQPIDPGHMEKMLADVKKNLADLNMENDDDIEFNF